jgi:hypothetical protein
MINALTTTTTTATDDNNHKGDKKDNYPQILNQFHNILNNAIPNNGINKDDEILFYYCSGSSSSDGDSLSITSSLSSSSIAILINNKYIDTIHDALLLRYQLLSIYIGPQSITPEAAKVIKQRYVVDSV